MKVLGDLSLFFRIGLHLVVALGLLLGDIGLLVFQKPLQMVEHFAI